MDENVVHKIWCHLKSMKNSFDLKLARNYSGVVLSAENFTTVVYILTMKINENLTCYRKFSVNSSQCYEYRMIKKILPTFSMGP